MNLLHINSYYSTSALFHQLYQRQIESGFNIEVYVPIPYEYPQDRLAVQGEYATVRRNHPRWSRWIFPLKHRLILKDLLAQYNFKQFQLIHAHSLFSNGWLAWQLYQQFNISFVVSIRNADLRTFFDRMPWMRNLGLKIIKDATHLIFISRKTYQEVLNRYIPEDYQKAFKEKSFIIPNGIDDFWHENVNANPVKALNDPLKLVVTSKIMASKRLVELADQVLVYSQSHRPAEIHVIGPTWEDKVLKKLQENPAVHYYGPKNKEEMVQLYREMDIFALLSYPETFGLVYVEAMSQGLPIIYTQGEGFDNFFPQGHVGMSVPAHNQEAFNRALEYIIDPTNLNTIQSNAVAVIKQFNWDDVHQEYMKLYKPFQ